MKVCGIDPSRSSFAVSFVEDFEEFLYKEYENSHKGYEAFIQDLQQLDTKPAICIEGYGDFAKQLVLYLQHYSYKIYEINPRMLNALKNSMTVHKTDHIDSYTSAIYYSIRTMKELNINADMEGLKNLCRAYRKLSKTIVSIKNELHAALNQGFGPVYKNILPNINNMSLIFYSKYGSIKEIKNATLNEIYETIRSSKSCRYKGNNGLKLAKKIKNEVHKINTDITDPFTQVQSIVIKNYAQALVPLLKQKENLKKQITLYIEKTFPNYKQYFDGIKGLTPLYFALLISEGLLTRTFEDEAHFASYCGQAPKQVQSANYNKFKSHKNYNRYLANTIHFIACQNVQKHGKYHNDYIIAKKYYNKKLRALKKIKRKLTRSIYYKMMGYKLYLLENNNELVLKPIGAA